MKFCCQLIITITKFVIFYAFFWSKHEKFWESLLLAVKKCHLSVRMRCCVLSNYRHDVYCPITPSFFLFIILFLLLFIYFYYYFYYTILFVLKSGQLIANQIWEFCYVWLIKKFWYTILLFSVYKWSAKSSASDRQILLGSVGQPISTPLLSLPRV